MALNYYLDTEFHNHIITTGVFKKRSYNVTELISLALVCEDGRILDIVLNDFDINAAWNSFQSELPKEHGDKPVKVYWLRDNVLKPIHKQLFAKLPMFAKEQFHSSYDFSLPGLKNLLKSYGKTKEQAKDLIINFCRKIDKNEDDDITTREAPKFWAYFADYDWVVFCSIFGRMLDLPTSEGFPMFCNDLKQLLEETAKGRNTTSKLLKQRTDYPKQDDEHVALSDSLWNQQLHNFLLKL